MKSECLGPASEGPEHKSGLLELCASTGVVAIGLGRHHSTVRVRAMDCEAPVLVVPVTVIV